MRVNAKEQAKGEKTIASVCSCLICPLQKGRMTFYLGAQYHRFDREHTNSTVATTAASIVNSIQHLTYVNDLAEINFTNVMASGDGSHFLLVSETAVTFPCWATLWWQLLDLLQLTISPHFHDKPL